MEDRLEALEKQVKKLKKKVRRLEAVPVYVYPSIPYYVPAFQPAFQLRPFTQPYYPFWSTSGANISIGDAQQSTTIDSSSLTIGGSGFDS